MDYEKWFDGALVVINHKLPVGRVFEAKHLFPAHEWEQLSAGEKKSFGRYFSSAVREERVPNVTHTEKGKAGQNRYIKVKAKETNEE